MIYVHKKDIHTVVSTEVYNKLKKYGNGILKDGIEKLIELNEKKTDIISSLCFQCKYWNRIDNICVIIRKMPTNSEYCKMYNII